MNVKVVSESSLIREVIANVINENFNVNRLESIDSLRELNEQEFSQFDFICLLVDKNQVDELEIVNDIKEKNLDVKILVMDLGSGRNLLPEIISLNIDGYIATNFKKEELISVIRIIFSGKKYYDGKSIIDTVGKYNYYKSYKLTEREKEILDYIIKGLDNKDIANNLYISENTVKKHVSSILAKLNFKNRKQAIIQMRSFGIV